MKRRRRRGERFSEESVDPMNYVSNLSDAMLVLAVGMMLALIVHWNVDISTGGRSSENVGETVAAEGQGGQSAIDRDNALSFTPEELEQMDSTEGETDEGMEKLGEVYYDAETGKYYIIENGNICWQIHNICESKRPRRAKLGHSDQKPKMKDFLFCAGNGKIRICAL